MIQIGIYWVRAEYVMAVWAVGQVTTVRMQDGFIANTDEPLESVLARLRIELGEGRR